MLAVAQDDRPDIAHAVAVDEHLAGGRGGGHELHRARSDLHGVAVFADDDIFALHSHGHRQVLVKLQHALLAVERDKVLRTRERVNDLELLLTGVTGDVKHIGAVIDDLDALSEQLVDDTGNGVFVAGDRGSGNDDAVSRTDLDLLVLGKRHAVERGHLLALRAGRDDDLLVKRHGLDLVDVHDRVFGKLHVAEVGRHLGDIFHAASGDGDLASAFCRSVDDLLDAVDVGGEGRDDDALPAALKQAAEGPAHRALRHRIARTLDIRRVGEQREDALLAKLAEAGEVNDLTVDRRGVDLEVAGVDGHAETGVDRKGHRVRDGVVDVDEFHAEFAGLDRHARFDRDDLGGLEQPVLLELETDQSRRQARAVDGHIDLLEDVGDRADVVLVTVGDEKTADAVFVFDEIADIGDHAVDAVHIVAGEGHAAVNDDDLAAVLVHGHVLADLVQTAKGNDF